MKKVLYFCLIILIYKIVSNMYCYFRIKILSKKHIKWINDKCPNFPTYKNEVISLFERAGIKNISTPTTKAVGFHRIASFNADIFINFPSTNADIFDGAVRMFYEAEGTFRHRIFEALSPMYWIESILFAPKKLLIYLTFDKDKALFKVCNVLLTFIWWSIGILFAFRRADFDNFLAELISQIKKFLG